MEPITRDLRGKSYFAIAFFIILALCAASAFAQTEATPVKACAVLSAGRARPNNKQLDTERIQLALNLCSPGKAVVLRTEGANKAFESAPLILPRGVTLFVDQGVTLYASANPNDYDLPPARCGVEPTGNILSCKPFIFAYQAAFSGVAGPGIIDGQGGAALSGEHQSWWDLVREAKKSGKKISVPDLVSSYESQGFKMLGITLSNAAGVHASIFKTTALVVLGLRIDSPGNSAAAAGLLLSNALDANIASSWIHTPQQALAIKASVLGASSHIDITDLHLIGSGISIGDDVFGDVHGITFHHAFIENAETGIDFNEKGAQGGNAHDIHFNQSCLLDVAAPLHVQQPDGLTQSRLPAARNIDFHDVVVEKKGELSDDGLKSSPDETCKIAGLSAVPKSRLTADLSSIEPLGQQHSVVVGQKDDGGAGFTSIQKAIDSLSPSGGDVLIKPGVYREVVTIRKPHVHVHGEASDPAQTTIIYNNGAPKSGGTFNTATIFVEADDVTVDHLTIANDFGVTGGQAVALAVTADRAIFKNLRILGAQDTLFAASRYCYGDYGPCIPTRQYFADSYIEGGVDFIFGDSKAVFDHCELHGISTGNVMYTAQDRHTAEQDSGYVFDHCHLTGEPRSAPISLGRPWRPYSTVVYLSAQIDAPVIPAGWTEWVRFGKPSLPTTFYAEYNSTGPGAGPQTREPYSHQLSAQEAGKWRTKEFLAGNDGWNPSAP